MWRRRFHRFDSHGECVRWAFPVVLQKIIAIPQSGKRQKPRLKMCPLKNSANLAVEFESHNPLPPHEIIHYDNNGTSDISLFYVLDVDQMVVGLLYYTRLFRNWKHKNWRNLFTYNKGASPLLSVRFCKRIVKRFWWPPYTSICIK